MKTGKFIDISLNKLSMGMYNKITMLGRRVCNVMLCPKRNKTYKEQVLRMNDPIGIINLIRTIFCQISFAVSN